jgi:hypothetical protein
MEQKDIDALKASALAAAKGGKAVDPTAVLALIATHAVMVNSEAFWGVRGPQLIGELNALRQVEPTARAMLAHGQILAGVHARASTTLAALDDLRKNGNGATLTPAPTA